MCNIALHLLNVNVRLNHHVYIYIYITPVQFKKCNLGNKCKSIILNFGVPF